METSLLESFSDPVDILLVEDNPYDAELVLRALCKQDASLNVIWLRDGVAALDFIYGRVKEPSSPLQHQPRLVILDLKLPIVEGRDVLRYLKHDSRTRCIPIVMLASSNEETDIIQTSLVDANSYIVKPVDYDQFTQAIQQIGFYWLQLNQSPR